MDGVLTGMAMGWVRSGETAGVPWGQGDIDDIGINVIATSYPEINGQSNESFNKDIAPDPSGELRYRRR